MCHTNIRKVKEAKGKFLIRREMKDFTNKHKHLTKSRRVTTCSLKVNNEYFIGRAVCNEGDNFMKKRGIDIALGRAIQRLEQKEPIHELKVPKQYLFREDMKEEDACKSGCCS